ncbi:amino acid-binding protein [Dictyobacter vulcani]|uniref:Amino acid-binding protein n=1 Tax=Dictyobacter vulcani TaxID=2607529 RepID=A0A5J4L1A9_9CHLR|nr:ACT domain-containing protein [Dictyobacter vulcani]GER92069.1 amino acid-binding protein [Dictyobacter vulcani]
MKLTIVPLTLAICRLAADEPIPGWALSRQGFFSITVTEDELSIVCPVAAVPAGVTCEQPWRAIKVLGPLDFALVGILAALAEVLARAQISIFAISTFDTDYILLKEQQLERAITVLKQAGHDLFGELTCS